MGSCRADAGRLTLVARAHSGEHGDDTEGRFTMRWASGARSTWRQVALVSVATLAAAACGGDDSGAGLETTTPTITTAADATTDSTPAATQLTPTTAPPTQPVDDVRFPVTVTEDVAYTSVDQLDVYAPATGSGWPVVVDFHGGFESRTPYPQGEFMAAQGVVVYRPTWASLGPAGGSEDTVCAMAFARATAEEHGGDPGRMLITGYSTGGFTAAIHALIGDDPPLPVTDCVVEPVMDAPAAAVPGGAPMFAVDAARAGAFAGNPQWSALSPEQLDAFDPYLNLGKNLDVRFVLVVGEEDVGGGNLGEIPIAASNDEFYAALRDAGYDVDLVLLPGGHEMVWGTDKAEIYAQTIVDTARSIGE
jgi:acetyl esterase/lipase